MRTPLPPAASLALALCLAGCDIKVDDKPKDGSADNGSVASVKTDGDQTEIAIPGIGTTVRLPKINLGNANMDLDGMKLYPGTEIVTMDVRDDKQDKKDGGSVRMTFTSKDGPAPIAAYYRSAAAQAGYTVDPAGGDAKVDAVKSAGKHFALQLDPQGTGAHGTIVIEDGA